MCSLARRPCTRLWLYVSSLVPGCRTALRVRPRMRSLAWWPCTRLVLSNSLPPPAMQDSTHARISTLSSKEKESIQTDIADKVIALRRKQAYVPPRMPHYPPFSSSSPPHSSATPRERPERPSQPSSSTPRPSSARPSSPRRLHAPPMPSPDIIVAEVSPQMESPSGDFSRRLKIRPNILCCALTTCCDRQSRQALQTKPGPVQRAVMTTEFNAMSDAT